MQIKKVAFIKTSENHARMHKRFMDRARLNSSSQIQIISIDMQEKLDELERLHPVFLFFEKASNIIIKKLGRHTIRFLLASYLKHSTYTYIKSLDVDAIILSDNYYTYIHAILISAARSLGAKVICVPFVNQDIEDIKISRINSMVVKKYSNGLMAFCINLIFPKWVSMYQNKRILWAHPLEILAMKITGLLPDNPIMGVANYVDTVLISGGIAKARFLSYGACEHKLYEIGDIVYDFVYWSITRRRCSQGFLLKKKGITVLFSLCPDLGRDIVYGTYKNYIIHYMEVVAKFLQAGHDVIVSLHPSTQSYVRKIINSLSVKIVDEDISRYLGRADIYFSSYTSTILLASYIGAIVIDHDIYRIGYVGNRKIPNVRSIVEPYELDAIVSDQLALNHKGVATQISRSPLVDGNVFDRFMSFL